MEKKEGIKGTKTKKGLLTSSPPLEKSNKKRLALSEEHRIQTAEGWKRKQRRVLK
jgi:hypothetical protein